MLVCASSHLIRLRNSSISNRFGTLPFRDRFLEHNYGHGSQFLSTTLLILNLLAFLAHTFLEVVDTQYRTIRPVLSVRKTFFHDFTTLTKYLFFDSWSHLIAFMAEQLEIEPANTG
jgi:hypothetical protein